MTKIFRNLKGSYQLLQLILIVIIATSCAHFESGQYIKLNAGDSLSSIAQEFKVAEQLLKEANKNRKIGQGSWIFVPQRKGVVENLRNPANIGGLLGPDDFIWPVPASYKISSQFGHRWGRKHNGIDISAREGTAIVSTANGHVIYSGHDYSGFGNMIVISHMNGYFSIYAHNKQNFVKKGENVYQGQAIAHLGNTGKSTGAHLHFEIRQNTKPLDPMAFVSREKKSMLANLFK